jgi:hypothetical protein
VNGDVETLVDVLRIWTLRDLTYVERVSQLGGPLTISALIIDDDDDLDTISVSEGDDWVLVGVGE